MPDLHRIHENRLLSRWSELLPRGPRQHGAVHETDSELVDIGGGMLLAINVDAVVEEIRSGLYDAEMAGRIAVLSALSDLSAVGAEALGVLLAVTLPDVWTDAIQAAVARGARESCEAAGTWVLGGDTNEGPELAVTCVAVGLVPREAASSRMGAQPGHGLWVTGPLGAGSAMAAHALLGAPAELFGPDDFRPVPRLTQGVTLRGIASACMDTSDGLVATVDQLARLNGVGMVIDGPIQRLLPPRVLALQRQLELPPMAFLAGHHGEFELVYTVPAERESAMLDAAASAGWTPIQLGRVVAGSGVSIDNIDVDAPRLRNLLEHVGGDPRAYATELIRLTRRPGGMR